MAHISSNTSSVLFYEFIFSEFIRIARCTLRNFDFIRRSHDLFSITMAQVGNRVALTIPIKKVCQCYSTVVQIFGKTHEEININIMKNT